MTRTLDDNRLEMESLRPRDGTDQALEESYRAASLWLDGLVEPLTPRASLDGDRTYDVAIVGAGFTGLWTAYYLKRHQPDIRVAVVEREIAGFGPSGRNGGWVSGGIAGSRLVYERRHGVDAVGRATQETFRAIDEIGEVLRREEIECGFLKGGTLTVATTEPQRQRLDRDLGEADDDMRRLAPSEANALARVEGCLAAAYSIHCARVDPARLVRGLAEACERLGVSIYERTEALELAPGQVRCRQGTLRAQHVLRATEAYTTQLPGERRRFLPLYSLMVATEPLSSATWDELGWPDGLTIRDQRHLFFYAQRTTDGRIAIGGRGAPYSLWQPINTSSERNEHVRQRLAATIERHFPVAAGAQLTHHWGGPLAVPRDWSMSVTYDRTRGVGSAGGYVGHGVAAANIAGRTLADLVLGRDTELVRLPWVGHESRRWEPEPLRFLASRAIVGMLGAADRYEDRTGRRARRTALLGPFLPPS